MTTDLSIIIVMTKLIIKQYVLRTFYVTGTTLRDLNVINSLILGKEMLLFAPFTGGETEGLG